MTLAIRSLGAGPDVVLLHGMPSPSEHFLPLARALADDGHRALVVDLPGYGASPPLAGEYTMERALRALEDALLARGVDQADVVGASAGSYRALGLALSGRVRVGRLVLLGAMAGVDPALAGPFLALADAVAAGADLGGMLAAQMLSPGYAATRPDVLAAVSRWIDLAPRAVLAAELRAMVHAPDLRRRLGALTASLHLRVGELDLATPPAWSAAIADLVPRATLEVVPGAGHALLFEDEAGTIEAVRRALAPDADPFTCEAPLAADLSVPP